MKLNYVNIITNNSIWVINNINTLFLRIGYSIEIFNISFDEKWNWHITIWFILKEDDVILNIISQIIELPNVINVIDMSKYKKQIQYIFNVNCNCKKTLKRISKEPDKILDTEKELVYIFFLKKKEIESFIKELNNLRLPFVKRVVWLI